MWIECSLEHVMEPAMWWNCPLICVVLLRVLVDFSSHHSIFFIFLYVCWSIFFFYLSCRWWEHYFGGDSGFFYCGDYCFFWGLLFVCVCESVTDTVTSKSCASFYFLLSVQACEGTEYISKLFKIGLDKLVQLDVEAQWGGSTCILLFILMLICAEL